MSGRVNRDTYQRMVDEDVAWLRSNAPGTPERRHIEIILGRAVADEYDQRDELEAWKRLAIELGAWVMAKSQKREAEGQAVLRARATLSALGIDPTTGDRIQKEEQ